MNLGRQAILQCQVKKVIDMMFRMISSTRKLTHVLMKPIILRISLGQNGQIGWADSRSGGMVMTENDTRLKCFTESSSRSMEIILDIRMETILASRKEIILAIKNIHECVVRLGQST